MITLFFRSPAEARLTMVFARKAASSRGRIRRFERFGIGMLWNDGNGEREWIAVSCNKVPENGGNEGRRWAYVA